MIPVVLPPLRARKEDIIPLARHFLVQFGERLGKTLHGFSPEALQRLLEHCWPGNVRELENLVERTAALSSSEIISLESLETSLHLGSAAEDRQQPTDAYGLLEEERVRRALEQSDGNRKRAADRLGISRTSLWRKMKKHGMGNGSQTVSPGGQD